MRLGIIGSGVAGVTTARLVAGRDSSADIALFSEEPYPYYPRPRLIDLLAGEVRPDRVSQYPPEWYEARGIQLTLGRKVVGVDVQDRRIALDNGDSEPFDRLVLATGARPWRPPVPGIDVPRVYTLRTMDDALALREEANHTDHAVVLGGGLLGLDTAMALRRHFLHVTVVELLPRLLPRQLDLEGASILQTTIEGRGLEVITDCACTLIEGRSGVERVHLMDGQILDAGLVVVSAGVRPNLDLAEAVGVDCGRGIVVDERMETSVPGVYAVGDVAEFQGRVWGIIPAALAQARVLSAVLDGETDQVYEDIVPSTTLKVTGIDLASVGEVNPEGDELEVRRTDPEQGTYKKLVVRDGRIVGAILLGDIAELRAVTRLVEGGVDVSACWESLLDQGTDLMELAREAGA